VFYDWDKEGDACALPKEQSEGEYRHSYAPRLGEKLACTHLKRVMQHVKT
jgi:hypothetical protein